MMKFIEERGSPFSAECPTKLHNFVTKQVMSEEIRKDVLNASEKGKRNAKLLTVNESLTKLSNSETLFTELTSKQWSPSKISPSKQSRTRAMNITEKSIEVARDQGLSTDDLLAYDLVPSPMLFSDDGLMTKPEKSQLVRELEEQLKPDKYSYHHKAASAFLIDVMAAVRRVPLSGLSNFSDLLSKFAEIR